LVVGSVERVGRLVMDIYDGAEWTEMDIEDLKAAIEAALRLKKAEFLLSRRRCR
jgi:hypothetical protein